MNKSLAAPRLQPKLALFLFLLCGIAVERIVLTYRVFSQTYDEPAHVAAGMEWLERGKYTYEVLHPPLGRIAVALGPFLDGASLNGHANMWIAGNEILHRGGRYSRNLILARLAVLPFFVLGISLVYLWSRKYFGETTALLAVLLFSTLPPVLAHAGLATTDMVLTATLTAALLAMLNWLERPTVARSLVLGLAIALAILSKLSALLFLVVTGLALLACHCLERRSSAQPPRAPIRRTGMNAGLALLLAALVIWAGYRFSIGHLLGPADRPNKLIDQYVGPNGKMHDMVYWVAESTPVPAIELFMGVNNLLKRNSPKNVSYLLGHVYESGRWYFFLVALAFKTPLPFLALSGIGLGILLRKAWTQGAWLAFAPAAAALALLLGCLPSRINLGVRHILSIYPLLAVTAGAGAASLWQPQRHRLVGRAVVLALLFWQVGSSVLVHPDYLAYFNELAGRHPDRILVDSDLDWGQDLLRLASAIRTRGIGRISVACFNNADLNRLEPPGLQPLAPHQRAAGWIAVSETALKMGKTIPPYKPPYDGYSWLESYQPVGLVGRSIRLYYVPEEKR